MGSAMPAHRPLRGWSSASLLTVGCRLDGPVRDWSAAWGLAIPADGLRARAAALADLDATWSPLVAPDGAVRAWWRDEGVAVAVGCLLWGPAAGGRMASALADACAVDLAQRLAVGLGLAASPSSRAPAVVDVGPWSGGVRVEPDGTERPFALLLGADAVQALVAAPPAATKAIPLARLGDALRDRCLPLQVRLEGCALDLGALAGLRIGDIVRLEHAVDRPAMLCDEAGRPCFAAHLAQRGHCKAVVLAANDESGEDAT